MNEHPMSIEIRRLEAEIDAMAKLCMLLKQDVAEKDAEIERLNSVICLMNEASKVLLEDKDAEIERLKALIARAAEALAYQAKFINDHCCDGYPECGKLIAELRKAAE